VNANTYGGNFFNSEKSISECTVTTYDDYCVGIEEAIKSDPRAFFGFVDLKKNGVGYPSVLHFEGRLASGFEDIC
jgi:hypothetical protein